jgi:hypothetical protein
MSLQRSLITQQHRPILDQPPARLGLRQGHEVHLRQIFQSYARDYNDIRTHRTLKKDAPVSRPVSEPV